MAYDSSKDYLRCNVPIPGQKWCCLSILGPDTKCNRFPDRLVKIRGVFETKDDATVHASRLMKRYRENQVDIYVIEVGHWVLTFADPEVDEPVKALNQLMYHKIREKIERKLKYEQRRHRLKENKEDPSDELKHLGGGKVEIEKNRGPVPGKTYDAANATDDAANATDDAANATDDAANATDDASNDTDSKSVHNMTSMGRRISTQNAGHLGIDAAFNKQNYCVVSFLSPSGDQPRVYGLKLHRVCETMEEADECSALLGKMDRIVHTFVACCGEWLPWDPDPNTIVDQEYATKELNQIFRAKRATADQVNHLKQSMEHEDMIQAIEQQVERIKEAKRCVS